jgi:hypothetical protein
LEKIPPSLESDIASKLHVFPWKTLKKTPFLAVERVRRPYHEEDLLLLGTFHQHLRVVDPVNSGSAKKLQSF